MSIEQPNITLAEIVKEVGLYRQIRAFEDKPVSFPCDLSIEEVTAALEQMENILNARLSDSAA